MIAVRKHLQDLQPYKSARDDFQGKADIFLDANENPIGTYNRYPDSKQNLLKEKIAILKNIAKDNIFIGNGSDEIIDLLMRLYCEPGKDEVMIFPPTYGMYQVSAKINNVGINEVSLTADFQLDKSSILSEIESKPNIKICFVCSPNNPTGNSINDINWLCDNFKGLVVVDEAYIDFAQQSSMLKAISEYENLLVSQTFSKAWGLAAARVGVAYASKAIIQWLTAIKPPYNVSQPNQNAALEVLDNLDNTQKQIKELLVQRAWLSQQLQAISFVKKIYPSDANFLLLEVDNADKRYNQLKDNGIVIRNRSNLIKQSIRITIGTANENERLLQTMKLLEVNKELE